MAQAKYNAALSADSDARMVVNSKRVEQIMARQVMTLDQYESPEIALRAMVAHAFHSVPVTEGGRLVGMITSSDFLREISYGQWPGHDEPVRRRMGSPGHTVDADATLEHVLKVAEEHSQEFIVVVCRYRPLGILSRIALRQCLYAHGDEQAMSELRARRCACCWRICPPFPAISCSAKPPGKCWNTAPRPAGGRSLADVVGRVARRRYSADDHRAVGRMNCDGW